MNESAELLKIVGLTGGIGSGKSTVASLFEKMGIPVYYSDDEAKALMVNSPVIRMKIKEVFGEAAFQNEQLNRPYLAGIVFGNEEKLKQLNSIVHPAVKAHFRNWIENQNSNYVIQENPLIFENNSQAEFDSIILVTAPLEVRIERVINRDGSDREAVMRRIENQFSDEQKRSEADFIIENQNLDETVKQVAEIHKGLLA